MVVLSILSFLNEEFKNKATETIKTVFIPVLGIPATFLPSAKQDDTRKPIRIFTYFVSQSVNVCYGAMEFERYQLLFDLTYKLAKYLIKVYHCCLAFEWIK